MSKSNNLMSLHNSGDYLMPMLLAGWKNGDIATNELILINYIGVCFYIDDVGSVATCAHCIENIDFSKYFVIAKDINEGDKYIALKNFKIPTGLDIAFAETDIRSNKFYKKYEGGIFPGIDVKCIGFNLLSVSGPNVEIAVRLQKGYIVRFSQKGDNRIRCNSMCEISFPVTAGFSGSPVVNMNNELIGMAFSNYESRISVYQSETIVEELDSVTVESKETINRVMEFGLIHTVHDVFDAFKSMPATQIITK